MTEFVDKEIVKEAIEMIANACLANPRITRGEIQTFFKGIPTADVRPVRRGRWRKIGNNSDGTSDYECSACLGIMMNVPDDDEHPLVSFCSMCGADMRGGDAESMTGGQYH